MRKAVLAASMAAALLAATQTPAWAAPTAPTDLLVSWADPAAHTLKLKWTDSGEANRFRIEYQDSSTPSSINPVAADVPNEAVRTVVAKANKVARVRVVSVDASGVESAPAYTAWFDTNAPAAPTLTDATPLADGSLRVNWTLGTTAADTTPNDPLDLPATSETVGPAIWSRFEGEKPAGGPTERFAQPAGTTSAVVPLRTRPYPVRVVAQNEWTELASKRVVYSTMTLGFTKLPAFDEFGRTARIEGVVGAKACVGQGATCGLSVGNGVLVTMQTRANATKPWGYAGRYVGDNDGLVAASRAAGSQQYRFYVPTWKYFPTNNPSEWVVTYPASTSARSIPTRSYFAVAGFNMSTAQVGQMVKLTVDVLPAGTVKGALQRWDGKVWRSVLAVPVTKGKALMYVRAAGRGTTTYYRVAVPGMTYYGLPIETTGSRAFKLTVR